MAGVHAGFFELQKFFKANNVECGFVNLIVDGKHGAKISVEYDLMQLCREMMLADLKLFKNS